jgi:hypothetical protein
MEGIVIIRNKPPMKLFQPILIIMFNNGKDFLGKCDVIVFRPVARSLVNWQGFFQDILRFRSIQHF